MNKKFLNYVCDEVKAVGYTGASVTVQANGYRDMLHRKLEGISGRSLIQSVNGVGGVGSLFCLMNELGEINFPKREIIFYECFTGDVNRGITPKDLLGPLLANYAKINSRSVLVYVLNYRHDKSIDEMREVAEDFKKIARKIGAVVVDVFEKIHEMISSHKHRAEDLFRDGVHPTSFGAEVIADIIVTQMSIESVGCPEVDESLIKIQVGGVIYDLSNIKVIKSSDFSGDLKEFEYKNTGQIFTYVEGCSFSRKLTKSGVVLGMLALVGPRSPLFVRFRIDKRELKLRTFDRNCFYLRPQTYSSLVVEGDGDSSIDVLPDAPDYTICARSNPEFELDRIFYLSEIYVIDSES